LEWGLPGAGTYSGSRQRRLPGGQRGHSSWAGTRRNSCSLGFPRRGALGPGRSQERLTR
jgi:hypothetical protein